MRRLAREAVLPMISRAGQSSHGWLPLGTNFRPCIRRRTMFRRLLASSLAALSAAASAGDVRLTMNSYGPVRVGMTVPALHAALKALGRRNLPSPTKISLSGCDYYTASDSLQFMIQDGRVARIETREKAVSTPSGIRVGDPMSKVRKAFADRLDDSQQHYSDDAMDRTLVVYSSDRTLAMRFEASAVVTEIYAGAETAIHYVEGCS